MDGQGKGGHIPAKFMAGRGRALRELASRPLKAEEVEKRRRLQELILRGSVPLVEKTGTVPGGLSQGKLQKPPSQASKHQNRRPDPIWTSYRSNDSSTITSGSEASVGKFVSSPALPQSEEPAQRRAHSTSGTPGQWATQNKSQDERHGSQYVTQRFACGTNYDKSQDNGFSSPDVAQSSAHGTQNKSQDKWHGSQDVTQRFARGTQVRPQSNKPGFKDATEMAASATWNTPLGKSASERGASTPRNAQSTWCKPGRNGSSSWDVPQNGGSENWDEPKMDGSGAWDTSQTDSPSVWGEPQSVNASIQKGKNSHNGFNQPRRPFRKDVPPRFRRKFPQLEKLQGARGKQTIANSGNAKANSGESSLGPALTQIGNDSQHSGRKDGKAGHSESQCATDNDAWNDWEDSVVIQGSLSEEDMVEIGVIEDNDDISDVFVNQYVSAMQDEENNEKPQEAIQLTPSKIQQLSKLKSTAQADAENVPPGTLPGPPKKLDRWGGVELQNDDGPVGWGDLGDGEGNWYDDGVSAWGKAESGPGWS